MSEIRFVVSPKLSYEHAHLVYKVLTVSWFIGAARRQPEIKDLCISQFYEIFRVFREDNSISY